MIAVIIAGGKGTRMAPVLGELPKILTPLQNSSLIHFQLNCLFLCGITEIRLVTGYGSDQIINYVRKQALAIKIDIIEDSELIGTTNAIKLGLTDLNEDVLVIYGDLLFDFNFKAMINFHHERNSVLTSLAHLTDHPNDSDLIELGLDSNIESLYFKNSKESSTSKLSLAGIHIISQEILDTLGDDLSGDFERNFIPRILKSNPTRVFAFRSEHFCKDIGTSDRFHKVSQMLKIGTFGGFHRSIPVIFLDRDGTLIENVPYLKNIDQVVFCDNSLEGLSVLKRLGLMIFIITNQPGIARGEFTDEELQEIHTFIQNYAASNGVVINDFRYCPHHPDSGFSGEIADLKILCHCRKPEIGLVTDLASEYNVDFSNSFVIGDTDFDFYLSENIGAKFIGIKSTLSSEKPIFRFKNLLLASDYISKSWPQL
jgi:histidinol-phosphate phosphatase family protein